jgi:N-acetylmuramoyl-L-alanine amidase
MSSTLRVVAVASTAALLATGVVATSAGAAGSPSLTISPSFGVVSSLVAVHGTGFVAGDTVTVGNSALVTPTTLTATKLTFAVPSDATSGKVVVHEGATLVKGPGFVVQQLTSATTTLSQHKLTFTVPVQVVGTLTTAVGGTPVAHQLAGLQHRAPGSDTWHIAKGTKLETTGPRGRVTWKITPSANGHYRVHFRSTPSFTAATSSGQALRVLPEVQLEHVNTVPSRTSSRLTGIIRPASVNGEVYLQKFVNGAWKRAGKASISHGHYSFTIAPSSTGTVQYRVVRHPDGTHGYKASHPLKLQVVNRTLSEGDTGPDVLALEKRLRALHYDTGTVSSSYSIDTVHAVTAFEKVQGLDRDGQAGVKVWKALNHPKTIKLRYPSAGKYVVEVNIEKQVLLLGKNGKVDKILDTSTAGGYQFKGSDGQEETAITPRGHFTFQYKLTGTHISDLGSLYYPSYFTNTGYAIHGEGNGTSASNVPPFPASHGCVRITDNAVLRYFNSPWLAVGSSVWIY